MALPERRDPDARERAMEDYERRKREAAVGHTAISTSTSTRGWGWVWFFVLLAVIWFAGWGWGGYGGWWWGRSARANTATLQISGPGVAVLNATDKQAFVGQAFQVRDVPVQGEPGTTALWIGTNSSTPMLVVLTGNGNSAANANIRQGDRVNVTGTVEKAPSAANAKTKWGLNDSGAKQLEQQGAFVQANEVERVQRQR